ncbi:MAG TPA: hypothetical protein VJT75_11790 [Thermoleophilaceae bacterium]|nr:hypothetical protein [Thermoleophilaceae bacterium]
MGALHRATLRWITRWRYHHLAINDEIHRERARAEITAITLGAVHEMTRIIESNRAQRHGGGRGVIDVDAIEIDEP